MSRPRSLGEVFALFTRNPISLLGTGLTTAAAVIFVSLWAMSALGFRGGGAYLGLITFVAIPMLFLLGLLLIPVGLWREKRRVAAGGDARATAFPILDFNVSRTRNIVLSVALARSFERAA